MGRAPLLCLAMGPLNSLGGPAHDHEYLASYYDKPEFSDHKCLADVAR